MDESDCWYYVLVQVNGTESVGAGTGYARWMNELREVIGAGAIAFNEDRPWTVGEHRRWETDHFGLRRLNDKPWANVWQQIKGVHGLAMAYVWASIHLVAPLAAAGYSIGHIHASRTDEMAVVG